MFMTQEQVDEVLDWAFPDRQQRQLKEAEERYQRVLARIKKSVLLKLEAEGKVWHGQSREELA